MLVQESMVLSGCVGLTVMWVANFKLLAYTGNRGALAHPDVQASVLVWAALLVLPFFPAKSGRAPASSSSGVAALGVLLKLGVWLGLNVVLLAPQGVPPVARHVCYAVYMWMFVSLCLDAAMPLSGALLGAGQRGGGLALQPAMDGPYAATSVREFWGRRYNQIVSATLLETVYKPIVQGKFMCGGQLEGSYRMLGFFLVQPLMILVQDTATAVLMPKAFRESTPGRLLQTVVTLAMVLASAELFWAALESCRIDERGLQEVPPVAMIYDVNSHLFRQFLAVSGAGNAGAARATMRRAPGEKKSENKHAFIE
eukprot:XP_001692588.1 predicted protein [Chlamydomonas reinhardtii]